LTNLELRDEDELKRQRNSDSSKMCWQKRKVPSQEISREIAQLEHRNFVLKMKIETMGLLRDDMILALILYIALFWVNKNAQKSLNREHKNI